MWKLVGFFIVFSFWSSVTAASHDKPVYKAIGGTVVLSPDSPAHPIRSITWKHGADLAMEWYGDDIESYRHFQDRGMLNTSSGAMTITGLNRSDSGSYSVRINNQFTTTTQLLVISPVSKPSISIWCHADTYCLFTCESNTTGAEPITYGWSAHDMQWSPASKVRNITKDDTEPVFKCSLENPVSHNGSEGANNPFSSRTLGPRPKLGIIISAVLLSLGLIIFSVYIYRRVRGAWDVGTAEEQSTVLLGVRQTEDPAVGPSHASNGIGNSALTAGGEETLADIQPADDPQETEPSGQITQSVLAGETQ